jgi:hypothetical protein
MIDKNTKEYIKLRRDYAAKAMQGLIGYEFANARFHGDFRNAVPEAFEIADAMIEFENKEQDNGK